MSTDKIKIGNQITASNAMYQVSIREMVARDLSLASLPTWVLRSIRLAGWRRATTFADQGHCRDHARDRYADDDQAGGDPGRR